MATPGWDEMSWKERLFWTDVQKGMYLDGHEYKDQKLEILGRGFKYLSPRPPLPGVERLKVKIAETLVYNDGEVPVYYFNDKHGYISCKPAFKPATIKRRWTNEKDDPRTVVAVQKDVDYKKKAKSNRASLLNHEELAGFLERATNDLTVCQRFVSPEGRRAHVVRCASKFAKPTTAWRIANKRCEMQDKKYDLGQRLLTDTDTWNRVSIFELKGNAMSEVEKITKRVQGFLEYSLSLTFEEFVCDFVKEEATGDYVFIQIKAFLVLSPEARYGSYKSILSQRKQPIPPKVEEKPTPRKIVPPVMPRLMDVEPATKLDLDFSPRINRSPKSLNSPKKLSPISQRQSSPRRRTHSPPRNSQNNSPRRSSPQRSSRQQQQTISETDQFEQNPFMTAADLARMKLAKSPQKSPRLKELELQYHETDKSNWENRVYEQNLAKVTFDGPQYSYPGPLAPLYAFFKFLARSPEEIKNAKWQMIPLKLKIPETLVFNDLDFPLYFYTGKDGTLKRSHKVEPGKIVRRWTNMAGEGAEAIAVAKTPDFRSKSANILQLLTKDELRSKLGPTNERLVLQNYVKPWGAKCSTFRLVYRLGRPSQVWVVTNKLFVEDEREKYPHLRLVTNTNHKGNTEVYEMKGKGVAELHDVAYNIIKYVETNTKGGFTIEEFVADFIRDQNKEWTFLQCKAFKFLEVRKNFVTVADER